MNTCQTIGRIVKEPEIKTVGGAALLNFTLAVQREYKNADGKYDADFVGFVAWRQQATFIQKFFHKGDKIAIVGSLTTRNFAAADGKKVYVTEVYVKSAEFVEPKGSANYTASGTINAKKDAEDGFYPAIDDDLTLPFSLE